MEKHKQRTMFGGSFFREFDEDPFFSMHRDRTHNMDEMFGSMFHGDPMMALTDGRDGGHHQRHREDMHGHELQSGRSRGTDIAPYGGQYNPFGFMSSMMSNMHGMMENAFQQTESGSSDPNSHSYMQSSVMSYSNTGQGAPKIYQATSATRQAPGGIRETRKAVRDSEAGIEKMAVGRHLNERGHVITRQKDTRTGDMEENQDYLCFDESDAPQFEDDWRHRTSQFAARRDLSAMNYEQRSRRRPIDDRHYEDRHDDAPRRSSGRMKAIEQGRQADRPH